MNKSAFEVTGASMRPASDRLECFYCHQAIGSFHLDSCVLLKKRVRLKVTIEYETEVPADWDSQQIEFHRNDGSWCADNMIDELESYVGEDGCICPITKFEHLADVSGPVLDEE